RAVPNLGIAVGLLGALALGGYDLLTRRRRRGEREDEPDGATPGKHAADA
ncbi:hypothetical protein GUY44_15625, partial [Pimelobacter simplex]|nr:hypothetical protein [Pimelobacter simplex]